MYSIGERIVRTNVFQIGVQKAGRVERALMWLYNSCIQKTCSPALFDEERAKRSLESLKRIGGEEAFLTPDDRKAQIHTMQFRAEVLEKKLKTWGAKWERVQVTTEQALFAIIPPDKQTAAWYTFEQDLLHLKWDKRTVKDIHGRSFQVIVTCEHAEEVPAEALYQKYFLHCNSASVCFEMLTRRIGFYLGSKQNAKFFNPRGVRESTGVASEGGYYLDAMTVFQSLPSHVKPEDIWLTSACGGSAPAAFIRSQNPQTHMIFENGYTDLKRDFLDQESWIVRTFATYFWGGLSCRDSDNPPVETGFNIEKLWENLTSENGGKVIVVSVANDQRLSKEVKERNLELARKISNQVLHLTFPSNNPNDPHFDRYYRHPKAVKTALKTIFSR